MRNLIAYLIKNSTLGNLITVSAIIAGMVTFAGMRREAFPNIDFDIVLVTTPYPGASPQEVEKLITIPVEREIKTVDGIKETSSTSLDSRSGVVLTLDPDVENKLRVVQDIRDAVDRAKTDFPEDAEDPLVTELSTSRTPVIELALSFKNGFSKKHDEAALRAYAKQLQDKLELLPDAASVARRGYRESEIFVEIFPDKLQKYNISADEIISALNSRNLNFPGGTVTQKGKEFIIRTVMEYQNAEEIRNTVIRANDLGSSLKIGDVAFVRSDFEKKTIMEKAGGEEAIILTVLKKENGDAINLVDQVKEVMADFQKKAPDYLEINPINDISYYIRRRLNVLSWNVALGMMFVILSLLFFMGWRISAMVALGIPFSFAITFLVMGQSGISINLISMFGLIIVSGMIVDDAIVVGENIYRYIEQGMEPRRAAIRGTVEMVGPVFASISTTMVAFAPLLYMSGIMGKFLWSLPAAVIIALAASLFESFFILPAHVADITGGISRENIVKEEKSLEARIFNWLKSVYRPILEFSLRRRYLMMYIVGGVFLVALVLIPITGFILFPKGGIEIFFIKAEGPGGMTLDEMDKRIRPIEQAVLHLPKNELDATVSRIGIHQEQPNDPFTKRGKNYAQVTVYLTPESKRSRDSFAIIGYLKRKLDPNRPVYSAQMPAAGPYANRWLLFRNSPTIEIRSPQNPAKLLGRIQTGADFMLGGGILPDGKTAVLYSGLNEFIHLDLISRKITKKVLVSLKNQDSAKQFYLEPQGKFGLLVTDLGYLYQIDVKTGSKKKIFRDSDGISALGFAAESSSFYAGTDSGTIHLFQYKADEIEESLEWKQVPRLLHKDGKFVFTKELVSMDRVESLWLDSSGKVLYAGLFNGTIYGYSLSKKKVVFSRLLGESPVLWVRSDSNGQVYAAQRGKFWLIPDEPAAKPRLISTTAGVPMESKRIGDRIFLFEQASGVSVLDPNRQKVQVLQKAHRLLEKLEFKQSGGGPPVGSPVQVEIMGDNFDTLRLLASKVKDELKTIEGVYDIHDNWETGSEEYHIELNEERAGVAGVTVMQVASTLQTAFEGRVATTIRESDEEIDIRVIFPENLRERLDSLSKVMVRNRIGNLVPITELATFKRYPGVSLISHKDNRRTLYVKANLLENKTSSLKVNQALLPLFKELEKKYPDYTLRSGGEYKDTQESMEDLGKAAGIALMGIAMILVLLFGNLRQPRVIMLAIPLGFIGVSIAFFLHKITVQPKLVFSFLATMGIVGLTGVVVNDSIILVDTINKLRRTGMSLHDAVLEAGMQRLRPVLLTTITTVFGLLPTAYGIGGSDPFLKPMALAMAWGLAFATMITLMVIPTYYIIWEDRSFVFHINYDSEFKELARGESE